MDARPLPALALAFLMAATVLAGCAEESAYDPNAEVDPTGRTVHLNISVQDLYETELYPGLKANLWAFCVTPNDPNDAYSAAAIQYWEPLPSDLDPPTTSWGSARLPPETRRTCGVPGPTIVVTQGDRVIVDFSHSHVHPHTIHWHGQFVDPLMDGAPGVSQSAVENGGSFRYEFVAKRAGTLWYHCHVDTQLHVMQGLYGMFIVKPQDTRFEPEADKEAHLVFSSMTRSLVEARPGASPHAHEPGKISGTPGFQNPPVEMDPDVFLVNGRSYPLTMEQHQTMLHVADGDRLRIRMLNAGTEVETIHLHGHDMLVTHRDGVPLPAPFWVDTLAIGPAERYDVMVYANNPGAWMMHTHVNSHETNDRQAPGGMHTMLVYAGHEDQCADCRHELPGGFPYEPPVFMPEDYRNQTVAQLNPSVTTQSQDTSVNVPWAFPVELPCAVRFGRLDASLEGGALGVNLSDLTVTVKDPAGDVVGQFRLGREGGPTGQWRQNGSATGNQFPQFLEGTYTVEAAGTAIQSTLRMAVTIDYHASFDEMKRLHHIDPSNYPLLCGKYGNGTDGLPPGAPP